MMTPRRPSRSDSPACSSEVRWLPPCRPLDAADAGWTGSPFAQRCVSRPTILACGRCHYTPCLGSMTRDGRRSITLPSTTSPRRVRCRSIHQKNSGSSQRLAAGQRLGSWTQPERPLHAEPRHPLQGRTRSTARMSTAALDSNQDGRQLWRHGGPSIVLRGAARQTKISSLGSRAAARQFTSSSEPTTKPNPGRQRSSDAAPLLSRPSRCSPPLPACHTRKANRGLGQAAATTRFRQKRPVTVPLVVSAIRRP